MGYDNGERIKYWKEISEDARAIKNKECIIWRTDNGQIINEWDNDIKSKMGNCTFSKNMRGGWFKLRNCSIKDNFTAFNTIWDRGNNFNELITGHIDDGETNIQIDYVMVIDKRGELGRK